MDSFGIQLNGRIHTLTKKKANKMDQDATKPASGGLTAPRSEPALYLGGCLFILRFFRRLLAGLPVTKPHHPK